MITTSSHRLCRSALHTRKQIDRDEWITDSLDPLPEFTVGKLIPIDVAQSGVAMRGARRFGYFYRKDGVVMHPAARIKKRPPPHFRFADMCITGIAKRHTDGRTAPAAQFCDLNGTYPGLPLIYGPLQNSTAAFLRTRSIVLPARRLSWKVATQLLSMPRDGQRSLRQAGTRFGHK